MKSKTHDKANLQPQSEVDFIHTTLRHRTPSHTMLTPHTPHHTPHAARHATRHAPRHSPCHSPHATRHAARFMQQSQSTKLFHPKSSQSYLFLLIPFLATIDLFNQPFTDVVHGAMDLQPPLLDRVDDICILQQHPHTGPDILVDHFPRLLLLGQFFPPFLLGQLMAQPSDRQ